MAISFDLKAHDAQFHPKGYVKGQSKCKFRDEMQKYESVDDLSKAQDITDALEDSELLEDMIANAAYDDARKEFEGQLKDTQAILDAILGKGGAAAITQFGPNAPLKDKAFPSKKDAKWQDALAHYGDSAYGWKSAGSGSTRPHYIDFNGERYFVKKAGVNPSYKNDAARNEANANNFLRLAGLNAPSSMYLKADDGSRFCISTAEDISGGTLESQLGDKKIAEQVADAYPIMSLLYNMDIMQNADNAYVDKNGKAMFLDNGSTFGFSAQGDRNKRFDFDSRDNPFPSNALSGGLMGLFEAKNNSSRNWASVFGGKPDKESVLKECAKYEMGALAREAQKQGLLKQMPKKGQDNFIKYADELDKMSSKYKQPKQAAAAAAGSVSVSGSNSNQSEIEKLAKKYGLSVPTLKDNGDGTKTLTGFGANVDFNKLREFVKELNEKGLIPGFLASLSQTGALTAAPALNASNVQSLFSGLGLGSTTSFNMASTISAPSSSGSFTLGGGHFTSSSAASSFANTWNSQNQNSGYTAKATQNAQTGQWEVTLYPTNKKQIAQNYTKNDASSSSSMGHSTGSLSAKAAARLQKMMNSKYASQNNAYQNILNASGKQQASQQPTTTTPSPAPQPKPVQPQPQQPTQTQPQAPTLTPAQQKQVQQVQAMPPAQRAKAIARLQKMMQTANPNQKAIYQTMISRMNGSAI